MKLTVKREGKVINEFRFSIGPIYMGRQIGSQVLLPDRAVSRQNTVLYTAPDGKWLVEDLDSANKTYLNNEVIHKAEIKNGDVLKISGFEVEINIDEFDKHDTAVNLGDTLHSTVHEPQIVFRHFDSADALPIKISAKRSRDFSNAATAICKCLDSEEMLVTLLDLMFHQFKPFHVWAGLRQDAAGAIEVSKGREISGKTLQLEEIYFAARINEVIKTHNYILIPRLPLHSKDDKINSAIIVPVMSENACLGALYADNSLDHEHYEIDDLDYLILVSQMAGAFLRNL